MRTNREIKARIKKLAKERDKLGDTKLKFFLESKDSIVEVIQQDIRAAEGEIKGLEWAMWKNK